MSIDELYADDCPNCGGRIPTGMPQCPTCGRRRPVAGTPPAAPPQQPASITQPCPNCGYMIPSTAWMCINCGWERNLTGAWPPKPGGPPRRPPPPLFPTPPARTPLQNCGLLILGIVTSFGIMAIAGVSGVGWLWLVPFAVAVATMRRFGMFALGIILAYPLGILGAFAACVIGLSHYNR